MARYTKADWLIPAGLLALAFIPVVAGVVRLVELASGAPMTPDNIRFIAAPIPVALHIVSVTVYCIVGAFQFSPGLRRYHPRWHRLAGRVLVPVGLVAALSGIWMALTYAIVPADNALLHSFRLLAGSGMAVAPVLGYAAIRRRDVEVHQGWMRRAYAIGQGAGTQALTQIPLVMTFGKLDPMTLAWAMGGSWMLNLAVAEWQNSRQRPRLRAGLA